MRFRQQTSQSSIPVVDLIPMLNVMLGILAFFVSVAMGLTVSRGVDVQLPDENNPPLVEEEAPPPLMIAVDAQGLFAIEGRSLSQSAMESQVRAYLDASDQGLVVLTAESQTPYEDVVQLIAELRKIGGDRVSLAIETAD
ncbi:MAG: biopolymer transporter ExbD [Elainellaceae cyanobacterium]